MKTSGNGFLKSGIKLMSFIIGFSISMAGFSQVFTVTNINDAGAGSLRQAITDANAYAGSSPQIMFDIPLPATNTESGWDWWTITLSSALPAITLAGTQILGFTQSVNRGIVDNNPLGTGGTVGVDQIPLPKFERPTICINENDKTGALTVNTASVLIEGLALYNADQYAIYVIGNSANTMIQKNFIGVLPSGNRPALDADRNNRMGIEINTNADNLVTVSHCYCGHNGRLAMNGASYSSVVIFEYNEVFESNWYGQNAHDGIDVNGVNSFVRYNLVYNTRSGNTIPITASNSGGAGIEAGSTTPSKETNFLIENNTCHSNDGAGINVINGCTKNTIRKNICYNNQVGVSVTTRTGTDPATALITMNSLYDNRGVGIDINHSKISTGFDGVTLNEAASVGSAPFGNNRQTFPVIDAAYNQDGSFFIDGSLTSVPNTTHRLEFYVNPVKDTYLGVESEYGEGKTFVLAFDVVTDNNGNVAFVHESPSPATVGYFLSATASNSVDMVTSEFSAVKEITDNGSTQFIENFYPASGFGTLAFEDLWPSKGDYDFNDLVVDYQFQILTNTNNKVEQVIGTFIIKAFGASFQNGFGFQISQAIDATLLNVTGYSLTENFIDLAGNGTENDQTKPTIIVFDNAYRQMQHPGVGIGVNTDKSAPYVTPDTLEVVIQFPSDVYSYNDLDISNFNPFIFVNKNRGTEVHLPDYPPTSKVNESLLGTMDDISDLDHGIFYKTKIGLPWAINIYQRFDYPIEKAPINEAHLHFIEWAISAGASYPDWYTNKDGYRNPAKIY